MAYEIDMTNKVAIVTGGARGIGGACTKYLAKAGAQCVITGTRNETDVVSFLDEIEKDGGIRPIYLKSDISVEEDVKGLVETTAKKFGRIDAIVANAGGGSKEFDGTLRRNIHSTMWLMDTAEPWLTKAENGGRVVIISSTTILYGGHPKKEQDSTQLAQYIAAKGGEEALSKYYARKFMGSARVNCILPGVIMTDAIVGAFESYEQAFDHYKNLIPVGRPGEPKDIAGAVLFLCSDLAEYITGYTYVLDGGRSILGY